MTEGPDPRPHPELDREPEPLSQETKEQFMAEVFGTLERSNQVELKSGHYDVDLFATGEHMVLVSRQDIGDPVTYELAFSIFGNGRDATIMAETILTAPDPEERPVDSEEDEIERLEREVEAERFRRDAGLGPRPATEAEVSLAVQLIRQGTESNRGDPA